MPRKLICTLGKPRERRGADGMRSDLYETAAYSDGRRTSRACVIPLTALVELYRPEEIIVLCTPATEVQQAYELFCEELNELAPKEGRPVPAVRRAPIEIPRDAAGVNSIIQAVMNHVETGDIVHLDVTFGLRAISYLAFLVTSFLENLRGARVERLTYINFEAPGEDAAGQALPPQIMDLPHLLGIPRLLAAGQGLIQRGDIESLARTIQRLQPGALQGDDLEMARETQRRLELLQTRQITSKGRGRGMLCRLQTTFEQLAGEMPLLDPIARQVEALLAPLDPGDGAALNPGHLARLARWYFDHQRPVHALLLMREAIGFLSAEVVLGERYWFENATDEGSESLGQLARRASDRLHAIGQGALGREIVSLAKNLRTRRNPIAHAGIGTHETVRLETIEEFVCRFEAICRELEETGRPE
ncbi:MAG: hypothetical protein M1457_03000 [bacterium]|nr:hypothetical protein [bacterium]